jgi:hypothetical protein
MMQCSTERALKSKKKFRGKTDVESFRSSIFIKRKSYYKDKNKNKNMNKNKNKNKRWVLKIYHAGILSQEAYAIVLL